MNILITGASGKIGKKILDTLLKDTQNKISVLSLQDDRPGDLPEITICYGDITDLASLRNAVKNIGPVDTVLHMAAVTHTNSKEAYYAVNLDGTKNLLKISEEIGVRQFIFISSRAACLGGGGYSESKLEAENEIRKSKLSWLILALGEVYEPNGLDEINRLYKMINNYFIIPIIGRGEYTLAPVLMDDAVNAILATIKKDKISHKRFIICGPQELTYRELVHLMVGYKKLKRCIIPVPYPLVKFLFWLAYLFKVKFIAYDQLSRLTVKKPADISEAAEILDFNPVKISDGLKLLDQIH